MTLKRFFFPRDWRLATKFSVLFFVTIVVVLTFFTLAEDAHTRGEVMTDARVRDLQRARATAQLLDFYLASVDANVQLIANAPGVTEFLVDDRHESHQADVLRILQFAREQGGYDAAFLLDQIGDVEIATDPRLDERNYTTATWFRNATSGRTMFDEPRYDAVEDRVYVHVSAPVLTERGDILGVAVVRLSLAPIDQIIGADTNFDGLGAFGVLTDEYGVRLSHPLRPELRFRPLAPLPSDLFDVMVFESRYGPDSAKILQNATDFVQVVQRSKYLLFDNQTDPFVHVDSAAVGPAEFAMAPLKNKRWIYAIGSPDANLMAQVRHSTTISLLQALAIGLIALGLSIVGSRWITNPVRRVADTARALSAGEMTRRVHLSQRDEVGQLANAFDAMADALAEKDAKLRSYAAELERRVRERTAELEHRAEEFAALYETARDLASIQDLQTVLRIISERVATLVAASFGSVYLYDGTRQELELVISQDSSPAIGTRLKLGEGTAGRVAQTREPLMVDDYSIWEHRSLQFDHTAVRSVVAAPMVYHGELIGVLVAYRVSTSVCKFTSEDARLLSLFASLAAAAVSNARLLDETRRRAEQFQMLYDAGLTLNQVLEPRIQVELLLKQATKAVRADSGDFFRRDPQNDEMQVEIGIGYDPAGLQTLQGLRFSVGEAKGHRGWVAQNRVPLNIPDVTLDARWIATGPDVRSALAAPVIHEDELLGVVSVLSQRVNAFSPQDEQLLALFANQAAVALVNARVFEETRLHLARFQALHEIDLAINNSFDLRVTLSVFLRRATGQLGMDAADILTFNPRTRELEYVTGLGFRTRVTESHRRLGDGLAGKAALERRFIAADYLGPNPDGVARSPWVEREGFVTHYAVPLVAKGEVKGVLELFHRSERSLTPEWMAFLDTLAAQAAIAIDNALLFDDLQGANAQLVLSYDATIEGWSRALDLRDKETEGHTRRVTEMTVRLAQALGIGDAELVHVRRGALLHDMGKMGVPDAILLKPGALTEEEWKVMRRHPDYAHQLLEPIPYLRAALDIPYCHHEKWDGTGYPQGLKGETIPMAARIFAVVDVWDALCSDRPYRKAWPEEKVLEHIRSLAGTHFDPQVVETFLRFSRTKP